MQEGPVVGVRAGASPCPCPRPNPALRSAAGPGSPAPPRRTWPRFAKRHVRRLQSHPRSLRLFQKQVDIMGSQTPSQSSRSFEPGDLHSRRRLWRPVPQVTVQPAQAPHAVHEGQGAASQGSVKSRIPLSGQPPAPHSRLLIRTPKPQEAWQRLHSPHDSHPGQPWLAHTASSSAAPPGHSSGRPRPPAPPPTEHQRCRVRTPPPQEAVQLLHEPQAAQDGQSPAIHHRPSQGVKGQKPKGTGIARLGRRGYPGAEP